MTTLFDPERLTIFDGGLGTMIQAAGLPPGHIPELWNIERPHVISGIHRQYLEAGADILTTNTFGANRLKLAGAPYGVRQTVEAAIAAARSAIRDSGRPARVALSLGPTGKLLQPLGELSFDEACDIYAEIVRAGSGADLAIVETMTDSYELKAAVLAIKEHSSLPVIASMSFDKHGRLLTGGDIAALVALCEGLRVDAIGLNCGLGPVQMLPLLQRLSALSSLPLVVNPNAGLPRIEGGRSVYDMQPDDYAEAAYQLALAGAAAIGGCCGTEPRHIAAMRKRCAALKPQPPAPKTQTVVSSYAQAVVIGEQPLIIGERINPTGKPRLKQALRDGDYAYILQLAAEQTAAGAAILDINCGLPELDEPQIMCELLRRIQGVCRLPLQIDSADTATLAAALRQYNGKALVNSVNGKAESMAAIFPLLQKYGGVVIALTLDEHGIPDTAAGRIAIAERIIATAASYGVAKKDIIIDALTMTVSANNQAGAVTLETLRRLKQELGVRTALGVSNISFGLPRRELLNTTFLTMALHSGLDAAIVNPNSAAMREAYRAYNTLAGNDTGCAAYIAAAGEQTNTAALRQTASPTLHQSVMLGLTEQAVAVTAELLAATPPMDVVNGQLIPALAEVGRGFEDGTVFLPQLLAAAEAVQSSFELIRARLAASGAGRPQKLKIVLATVQGDIHDIGKNIVRVLLENYGHQVVDLGKDISPEHIAAAALAERADVVGLSALMTTTVAAMEDTVKLLHTRLPALKIMVGGAVLTAEYAARMGADFYAADAMAGVRYVEQLYQNR
ncbi:MAG: homocysteine S-methyltransferase family protein [Bacillota bacterium]|nr:homocysteine S-methyltransferase family protein [Bacillota bacterium]